jgi:hypothetical protein
MRALKPFGWLARLRKSGPGGLRDEERGVGGAVAVEAQAEVAQGAGLDRPEEAEDCWSLYHVIERDMLVAMSARKAPRL